MKTTASLTILIIFLVTFGHSQKGESQKRRFIRIPDANSRVFVSSKTNSPLRFEEIQLFVSPVDVTPTVRYVVKNTSSKPIKFFSVEFYRSSTIEDWGKYGVSQGHAVGAEDGSGPVLIQPDGYFENIRKDEFNEIEPNDKVNSILRLKDSPDRPVVVFLGMVTKVIFEDGTTYKDSADLSPFIR